MKFALRVNCRLAETETGEKLVSFPNRAYSFEAILTALLVKSLWIGY